MTRLLILLLALTCFVACADADRTANQELAEARAQTDPTDVTNNVPPAPVVDPRAQTVQELNVPTQRADDPPRRPTKEESTLSAVDPVRAAAPKRPVRTPPPAPNPNPDRTAQPPPPAPAERPNPPTVSTAPPPPESSTLVPPKTPAPAAAATVPDHSAFDRQLRRFVNGAGNVDYAGWKRNQAELNTYLDELAANPPQAGWSRNERLAYWINAYNAFTIDLILDNYPVAKITDLDGGKPWDVKRIRLGDKTYSLNQIEHEIIRPQFNEPRIHFAVNCAAASCPPLHPRAYTADNLNATLERVTTAFVNNPSYNQISGNSAALSKIFDWYGEDFGDVSAYVDRYYEGDFPEGATLTFRDYDWSLNKQ